MVKVAIVEKRSNGDVEYKVLDRMDDDMRWLKWSVIFLLVALLCPLILKSIGVTESGIAVGIFVAIAVGIFVCLVLQGHFLGKDEAKLVVNGIDDIIKRDAAGRRQKVLKVMFCSDSIDSYGTIDEEYVLVLLSDKTVLKYPIRQLNRKDEKYNHKLIVSKCEVCKNEKQKRHIIRKSLLSKVASSPIVISFVTWIVIALILGFGVGLLYLLVKNMKSAEDLILPIVVLLGLLVFVPLYDFADKKLPRNRFCAGIRYVLGLPLFVLELTKLAMPFFTIMITMFLMFAYSFMPVFAIVFYLGKMGYDITMEGRLFILLTIPLIIATHCSGYIRGIILKMTPFSNNDHHFHLLMRELVRFVYTKENLNFIVYASYFVFLFISSFKSFQSGEPLLSAGIDMVVAKSFLVYIACTNMLDRKRSSNLEGGELLSLFVKMMIVHDDEEWRMKRKNHQLEE